MIGEYGNGVGQGSETIGDVLLGPGSFQDGLKRLSELLLGIDDELANEISDRDRAASDFVNTLESFVTALSVAADALVAPEIPARSPAVTGGSAGDGALVERVSSVMGEALQSLDQSLAQAARFMDDAMAGAGREENRAPFSGGLGQSGPGQSSPADANEWGVIRVDELNQAIEEFISTLGRIEQIMERATDIRVTVDAGDGWD